MPSDSARDAVVSAYVQTLVRHRAKQLSRKPGFREDEYDDIRLELLAGLLARLDRFDPRRASFHTFVDRILHSLVADIVRQRKRLKRGGGRTVFSIEETCEETCDGASSLRARLNDADGRRRIGATPSSDIEQFEVADDIGVIVDRLPENLQSVCHLVMQGESEASIARILNISRRQARKLFDELHLHFRKGGYGEFDAGGQTGRERRK